ncbi:helix-turn-helix domain-containing protein [Coraliomargarita parva]
MLGISAPSVDRLTKRGLLRPSRATRRPLYSKTEIERFLRETSEVVY